MAFQGGQHTLAIGHMALFQIDHISHARAAHALAEDDPNTIPEVKRFIPNPPEVSPRTLFPPGITYDSWGGSYSRFVHPRNPNHILIYTDGACSKNGAKNAAAGCAFCYRPAEVTRTGIQTTGVVSFRLEDTGPSGLDSLQTSNRAELRAAIAALQYRDWWKEGQMKIVIATDSEYVVLGVTQWVRTWGRNGWRNSNGRPVANRDLWEELLKEVSFHQRNDVAVEFWRIPRAFNTVADKAAKAATEMRRVAQYSRIY